MITIQNMNHRTTGFAVFVAALLLSASPYAIRASDDTVASKYKAPIPSTPRSISDEWELSDAALLDYVERAVPDVLQHTGASAFDEHLRGVQAVLRGWKAPEHTVRAGLFHSIYGTEGFQGFALPLSERGPIADLLGERAERLCWIFCMVDRSTVDATVIAWSQNRKFEETYSFRARPELGQFKIAVSKDEWLDFIELNLADWLEQVEGAASKPSELFNWNKGEAYAYRRDAYRFMSELLVATRPERLGAVIPAMMRDVYGTESEGTRHLVQPRTPPMSASAERALEALRSAGEIFPVERRPVPRAASVDLALV
eukprot:CAMPEP_0194266334 /NCGR_PEP_ID=MMETSP0169-20130528/1276_1 /TAXON_ID=218684 /ORGANISM="Corethron pennatum, Strain L29A3" /LENGTH=313 /DNA_ID=CAMNT_0039006995 /DNA_START=16 /DNA_END=957 /DNA_ORIENTATION=+